MFKKYSWIIAAHCASQQAYRVLCIARKGHLPAYGMGEKNFICEAVPGIAAFGKAARHTNHNWRSKFIGRTPTNSATIVELLGSGVGIFSKLYFSYRHQPSICKAYRTPDDAFLRKAGIKDSVFPESGL